MSTPNNNPPPYLKNPIWSQETLCWIDADGPPLQSLQTEPTQDKQLPSKRQLLLEEAIRIVTKDRNATHGSPEDNFAIIANLWDDYLTARNRAGPITITRQDVAVMMILAKISRIITSPSVDDHWIDIAGYAACGGGIKQ